MQTPATRALDRAGVAFTVTAYEADHDVDGYGSAVVTALDLDPAVTGKTLVVRLDDGRHVLAVVPVASTLDLKALARAAGVKKAAMADVADAERLTGSVVGAIAPLGARQRLPVFVDASLADADVVHVSAGRRGAELSLAPGDLVAVAAATVTSIRAMEVRR